MKSKHCYCDKITKPHKPGWFERLLLLFFTHFDIIKTVNVPVVLDVQGLNFGERVSIFRRETVLYLRRFYIWRSKWIGLNWGDIYIHHIMRPDDDQHPHSHPWKGFITIPFWGNYFDEQWKWELLPTLREFGIGTLKALPGEWVYAPTIIYRKPEHLHRVVLLTKPAWTVVLAGPQRRTLKGDPLWHFYTEDGPVFWKTYLGIPTLPDDITTPE